VGVDNLVVLACVLRATTKKVVNLLGEEKCTPVENPGYVYVTLHASASDTEDATCSVVHGHGITASQCFWPNTVIHL